MSAPEPTATTLATQHVALGCAVTRHRIEHRGGPRANSGGPRPNAGRPRLPRLTADEAKALLRELAPDARTPAEVARALGCRPERVREARKVGCTVATAERWRVAIKPIGLEEG